MPLSKPCCFYFILFYFLWLLLVILFCFLFIGITVCYRRQSYPVGPQMQLCDICYCKASFLLLLQSLGWIVFFSALAGLWKPSAASAYITELQRKCWQAGHEITSQQVESSQSLYVLNCGLEISYTNSCFKDGLALVGLFVCLFLLLHTPETWPNY